jgi:hypothetical protein
MLFTAAVAASIAVLVTIAGARPSGDPQCRGNSDKKLCVALTPTAGSTVSGQVAVSAEASNPIAGITFKLDGTTLGSEDAVAPYAVQWDTTKSSNGTHTLSAVARTSDGKSSTADNQITVSNVAADTSAPSVSFSSPAAGATVSGLVSTAASASDNVGVVGVQFKLDGANLGSEDTSSPYGVSWDSSKVSNATHTLSAVARDAAGNSSTASRSVTVSNTTASGDTTPPSVSFSSPAAGATVSGLVSTAASASDNVGVVGVQFKLDGTNLGSEDTSSPYGVSWDSTKVSSGSHTLSAVARDAAGNSTSTSRSVTVSNTTASGDTTPPSVSFSSPAAGATVSGLVSIAASASDNVGVVGVQFKLDGTNLGSEDTSSPYGVSWDSTRVANGSHTLSTVARDAAGNTASASRSVTVSNSTGGGGGGGGGPALTWAPPALSNPVTIPLPTAAPVAVVLDVTRDYILKLGHITGPGGLSVTGGHNVVIIGGQVTASTDSTERNGWAMRFYNQTGTVHIEGVLIDNSNDGITIQAPLATFQIENVRISNNHAYQDNWSYAHPDLIQTWSGPSQVRIDRFTGYSDYQGLTWMRAGTSFVYPGSVTAKNMNIGPLMPQPNTVLRFPDGSVRDKPSLGSAVWHVSPTTLFSCSTCFMTTGWWDQGYRRKLDDSTGSYMTSTGSYQSPYYELRGLDGALYQSPAIPTTGAGTTSTPLDLGRRQGDRLLFPRTSQLANEIWTWGMPSGGDFVPAGVAGVGYASPGYS